MNSKGFTQLPNQLWDMDLTVYERVVMTHIIRKTIGWGKVTDGISLSQFVETLGVSKNSIIRALKSLESKKIITKKAHKNDNGSQSFNRYGVHKNIVNQVNMGSASGEQG